MNNVAKNEKSKIFEAILISPGMMDTIKIGLQLTRRNVLLLARLIEVGLLTKDQVIQDELITELTEKSFEEFKLIHHEILEKSQLKNFYEKVKVI